MINKFTSAAWEGDIAMINALLREYDQGLVNEINKRGQTALYCAARQGQEDVVKILMKCRATQINMKMPGHGGTALHGTCFIIFFFPFSLTYYLAACYGGHAYVVSYLLYWGANINIENISGLTARQEAKGQAIDVFAYHENGKGDEDIAEICQRAKTDVS